MKVVPGLVATGATALDANAPKLASTFFDSMIGLLAKPATDAPDGYLQSAFNARTRPAGQVLPFNLTTGALTSVPSSLPDVIAADAAFSGNDSLDLTGTDSLLFAGLAPGQSWTLAIAFMPRTSGATCNLLFGATGGVGNTGAHVIINASGVDVAALFGATPRAVIGPRTLFNETSANIMVLSADHVERKVAAYINSRTPILSSAFGPTTWPVQPTGQWGIGFWTGSGNANVKIAAGAICNHALHVMDDGPRRIDALIVAAAKQYGISLI